MSNRLKPLDYFFLTRPILFFPGWATLLAGYLLAGGDFKFMSALLNYTYNIRWWDARLVLGLLLFAAAMGGCFVLNQLQDIDSDKNNNKLFLLGDGHISQRAGYAESFLLILISLGGAFLINSAFFFMVLSFILITGYAYNFPPFILKNKPVWGLIANMAMGWLAFAMGWTLIKPVTAELFLLSLPFLFFNTSLYFLTTVPDIDGDRQSRKITFPVKFGVSLTMVLCLIFFIFAALTSLWHKIEFMLVVVVLTAPFMLRFIKQKNKATAIVAVKVGIASFALLICLAFPLFFLLLGVIFFLTRFYYKNRFNFDYPNFKGR